MNPARSRFPLMALGVLALLAGLWAGLLRLGWGWPPLGATLPAVHGPLMVSGFLGTLVSLERAVALRRRWTYLAPLLSGLGAVALVAGLTGWIGSLLMTLASLATVGLLAVIVRLQPAPYTLTMAAGAVSWLIGNLLWLLGWPIAHVVLWWVGFLILTVAGERLELSRLRRPSPAIQFAFLAAAGLFLAGTALTLRSPEFGTRLAGAGLVALAGWLMRHDIARHTARQAGLTRFIAFCLLAGYVWLAAAGLMMLAFGGAMAGLQYDAMLHAIFLGFVISLIFGHTPILLPAVLSRPVAYHRASYGPLALLHLSLVVRIAGDLANSPATRGLGGLLNVVAILLFLGSTAYAARQPSGTRSDVQAPSTK